MKGKLLFGVLGGTALLALAASSEALANYEEPAYSSKRLSGSIELRAYPELIAAQVEMDGHGKAAADNGFRILAAYIFGKNKSRSKISMTVPVTESNSSEKIAMTVPVTTSNSKEKSVMRFYMPSRYSLESLPEALDKRIKFLTIPKCSYAVIRFSGSTSDASFDAREAELRKCLTSKGIKTSGNVLRAFYNPPWTLPFLRRNELWLQVEES
ncbi:MAG: heme-binding protein [Candidatus Obscuribacterales bacterium]|nr:heme-binding protein [Candidatus Obscuribacterales bacterium]